MMKPKLSFVEISVLVLVALVVLVGFILFYTSVPAFEKYVQEDRLVEWLTVLGLLLGSFVCFRRFFSLFRKRSWWFLLVTFLLGLVLFFFAGEEISWGQRIFGIASPEYFVEHNSQHEMNIHNLIVDGVKLNKLVFSVILICLLGVFLLLIPFLYERVAVIKRLADRSAVTIPRLYQIVALIVLFGVISLLHHEKNAELLECGGAFLVFLMIRYPKNYPIFQ